jgi:hypothetical protein
MCVCVCVRACVRLYIIASLGYNTFCLNKRHVVITICYKLQFLLPYPAHRYMYRNSTRLWTFVVIHKSTNLHKIQRVSAVVSAVLSVVLSAILSAALSAYNQLYYRLYYQLYYQMYRQLYSQQIESDKSFISDCMSQLATSESSGQHIPVTLSDVCYCATSSKLLTIKDSDLVFPTQCYQVKNYS